MKLGANGLDSLRHGTALDLPVLDFTGTAVNRFAPLRFGVSVRHVVKAGNKLAGQKGPVLSWQRQNLDNFFSGNAHAPYSIAMAG
jgi:hypothetical protein